jgi:sulfate/thiosulfate transport system substrate-binding protein
MWSIGRRKGVVAVVVLAIAASGVLVGRGATAGPTPSGTSSPARLDLVGFAVAHSGNRAARDAFAALPVGHGIRWTESYGASGDQSRSVARGLDADYVHFSLPADVVRLVKAGLVAPDWNQGPNRGVVTRSVVVIVTRPGNPKNISGWDDLVRPGIEVVTPNPGSSGSARWNTLAAYGHVVANGGTPEDAATFLRSFFDHVVSWPGSGRDATSAFLAGTGDALIAYENEAILARQAGENLEYFIPKTTVLIENPGAILIGADARAEDWMAFVLSPPGQRAFMRSGFRPVLDIEPGEVPGANSSEDPFPAPKRLLSVDADFGGWAAVDRLLFEPRDGLVARLQRERG